MARKPVDTKSILTVGFLLFTFASGLLIMLASKRNTEDRSKAAGPGPYNVLLNSGQQCSSDASPTQANSCANCPGGADNAHFDSASGHVVCGAPNPTLAPYTGQTIPNGGTCSSDADASLAISCDHCPNGVSHYVSGQGSKCGPEPSLAPYTGQTIPNGGTCSSDADASLAISCDHCPNGVSHYVSGQGSKCGPEPSTGSNTNSNSNTSNSTDWRCQPMFIQYGLCPSP